MNVLNNLAEKNGRKFPLPSNERERLEALRQYNILDTISETEFDDLAVLASQICQTPIATITLVDENRQWHKSKVGISDSEAPREVAFCAHTICEQNLMIVPDAQQDNRFIDNPFVVGQPCIRFYAGAPLITAEGYAVGTLCVIDTKPRELSDEQRRGLQALARSVMTQLTLRRKMIEFEATVAEKDEAVKALNLEIAKTEDLYDNAPCGYHSLDADGVFLRVNETEAKWFGYEREELIGKMRLANLLTKESSKVFQEEFEAFKKRGWSKDVELELKRRNGTVLPVILSRTAIRDEQGKFLATRATMFDISDRKVIEAELRQSEAELRALLSAMSDLILVLSADGHFLKVSPTNPELLHKPAEEISGKHLYDVFPREQADAFLNYIEQTLISSQPISFEYALEINNQEVWFSATASKLSEKAILWVARDITIQKQAESKLRAAHRRLQFHVENSPMGVVEWDKDLKILQWSPEAERIFGWSSEEAIGRQIGVDLKFIHEEDESKFESIVAARLFNGFDQRNIAVYRNYTKDGAVVTCEWFSSALLDEDGELVSVMSLALNVTERIEMEARLRKARDAALESANFKSAFLANISHEIRTPMNGIIGMSDLLLETPLGPQQREFTETIRISANALLIIINDILDLSKIEAGKLAFETIDFDLLRTIEDSVGLMAERAYVKRIELVTEIDSSVPTRLGGDPNRLRQVLLNLLSNALKFTAQGEVIVRVSLVQETDESATLRFSVQDTGIGISRETQKRLFEPFMQADVSTTRRFGGTGLGLAISKQLVELMHGEIGVESESGEGAKFWFTAQFKKQAIPFVAVDAKTSQTLENVRVLIIENNAALSRSLARQMAFWKMLPDVVENYQAAWLQLERAAKEESKPYDLIVLDTQAPSFQDVQFADAVRLNPALAKTKLMLLTAVSEKEKLPARDKTSMAILTKPVRQGQLLECLTKILENHSASELHLPKKPPETSDAPAADSQGLVLLVEDNPVNIKVAYSYLKKFGYQVEAVANGRQALQALSQKAFDLVLMDCQMPEMNGFETTAEIRNLEHRGELPKRTTIVAITANAMEGDRQKCLAAGMDDYLSKPIKQKDLYEILERWKNNNRAARETVAGIEKSLDNQLVSTNNSSI